MSAQLDRNDPYYSTSVLSVPDQLEAAKMEPFNPLGGAGVPWWQAVASYGIVRAIDNRFGPTNVAGNTQAGSFAGANGRSYAQQPSAMVGGLVQQLGGTSGLLMLGAAAVVAFLLLKR